MGDESTGCSCRNSMGASAADAERDDSTTEAARRWAKRVSVASGRPRHQSAGERTSRQSCKADTAASKRGATKDDSGDRSISGIITIAKHRSAASHDVNSTGAVSPALRTLTPPDMGGSCRKPNWTSKSRFGRNASM